MKKIAILLMVLLILISCSLLNPVGDIQLIDTVLNDQFVVSMAFEDDGTVWAGIIRDQYGLVRIDSDGSTEIFDHTNSLLKDSTNIWDMEFDSEGRLWMINGGLVCYDGSTFTRFDTINDVYIPESIGSSLTIDSEDNIWFVAYDPTLDGSTLKIFSYNGNDFNLHEPNEINYNEFYSISDIEVDQLDNIWFSFNYYRDDLVFLKFNGAEWTSYDTSDIGFVPYRISDIEFDNENNLWFNDDYTFSSIAFQNKPSVYVFDGIDEAYPVAGPAYVSEISLDEDDNIWVSGLSPRLSVYNGIKWTEINNPEDVSFCRVMQKAPNGDMCLGTSKGISIFRFLATK